MNTFFRFHLPSLGGDLELSREKTSPLICTNAKQTAACEVCRTCAEFNFPFSFSVLQLSRKKAFKFACIICISCLKYDRNMTHNIYKSVLCNTNVCICTVFFRFILYGRKGFEQLIVGCINLPCCWCIGQVSNFMSSGGFLEDSGRFRLKWQPSR